MQLRLANNGDCDSIIKLIAAVLREYDDDVCLDDSEQDLLDIEANYFDRGGSFWVLVNETGRVVGTHAVISLPDRKDCCTFKRLYLEKSLRGKSHGGQLMQITIGWARQAGFKRIEFWSDTRFKRAHVFFRKHGFRTDGTIRHMTDSHDPYEEYWFWLDLGRSTTPPTSSPRL